MNTATEDISVFFTSGHVTQKNKVLIAAKLNRLSDQYFSRCFFFFDEEWAGYFESNVNLDTIKEKIVIHTRQFAKRQKTWFKHQIPGLFVDSLNEQEVMNAYLKVKEWCEK